MWTLFADISYWLRMLLKGSFFEIGEEVHQPLAQGVGGILVTKTRMAVLLWLAGFPRVSFHGLEEKGHWLGTP